MNFNLDINSLMPGLAALLAAVGSKYIHLEFDKDIEDILRCAILRKLIVLSIAYTATKDIYTSIVLTAIFYIFINLIKMLYGKDKIKSYYNK